MNYLSEVEGKGGIRARVVAASVANDIPLTTLELKYPRFIHSEFMTHRMFSRNAASSRAIPVKKMIEQVRNDTAMPIHWGKNKPGMQADEEHNHRVVSVVLDRSVEKEKAWKHLGEVVAYGAKCFSDSGYHKQVVNRLLEPFQFMHTVVTATEWDNFFKLRLHKDAQPEIYELARVMKQAMEEAQYTELLAGEWHTPYVVGNDNLNFVMSKYVNKEDALHDKIKCSTARIARVSFLNHDKSEPSVEKDIGLHDMLLEAGHMSPFEQVATPIKMTLANYGRFDKGVTHVSNEEDLFPYWSSNFRGWIQYRNLVGE